jgi:hypothetical protein
MSTATQYDLVRMTAAVESLFDGQFNLTAWRHRRHTHAYPPA